jgi:hypothetical protein
LCRGRQRQRVAIGIAKIWTGVRGRRWFVIGILIVIIIGITSTSTSIAGIAGRWRD